MNGAPKRLLELGSGWAAGREIVAEFWPEVDYWGINSSPKQIAFARKKFENSKSTFFRQARFEDLTHEKLPPCDAVLAVEAMLHVENKSGVINLFNQLGAKTVAFAEICTTNLDRVLENPLFRPSLNYLWSTENYRTTLLASGFAKIEILEIGRDVFSPWSQTLLRIKSESFSGHPRILRQFQSSYRDLSHLFDQGVVSYQLIFASRESF